MGPTLIIGAVAASEAYLTHGSLSDPAHHDPSKSSVGLFQGKVLIHPDTPADDPVYKQFGGKDNMAWRHNGFFPRLLFFLSCACKPAQILEDNICLEPRPHVQVVIDANIPLGALHTLIMMHLITNLTYNYVWFFPQLLVLDPLGSLHAYPFSFGTAFIRLHFPLRYPSITTFHAFSQHFSYRHASNKHDMKAFCRNPFRDRKLSRCSDSSMIVSIFVGLDTLMSIYFILFDPIIHALCIPMSCGFE